MTDPRDPASLLGLPSSMSGDGRGRPAREMTDQAVLDAIFRDGPTTRPAIARATGLSKPTVSETVRRLWEASLITEQGQRRGRAGRVPTLFGIDPSVGFVIGIDVGGSNVRLGCADINGNTIAEEREETHVGAERLPSQLLDLVRRLLREAGVPASELLSFGISTPGVVDPGTGRLRLAYNLGVDDDLDIAAPLEAAFGITARVENNVNLAAIGERWRGLAHDRRTFAVVAIGAGVGMGLVYDDMLLQGTQGTAGEIGYMPFGADPLDPVHRRRGSLEDEAGGAALLDAARNHPGWALPPPSSVAEIFRAADGGDAAATDVVVDEGRKVAYAVASISAVIDPGLVILGGGIGSNPMLRDTADRFVKELLPLPPTLETSSLGDAAALHGATAVALHGAREALAVRGKRGA